MDLKSRRRGDGRCRGHNPGMTPDIKLSALEARVIGCLIEKAITTPEQYPLSLNALVNACNQKNNRDPVLELAERDVEHVLADLERARLVAAQTGFGSRVTKYSHRFCNTEFSRLKLDAQELAVVCELLLRGAQMPGELRSRASRMAAFRDVAEMEHVLERLATRPDGPFAAKLAREPGRRESRYMHLFGDGSSAAAAVPAAFDASSAIPSRPSAPDDGDALARLEAEVAALREELAELREAVAALREECSSR